MPERPLLTDLLKKIDCFATLDDGALALVADGLRTRQYPAGGTICSEGEPGDWMFVVDAGEIDVLRQTPEGASIKVATLRPGDFGGLTSLLERQARSATLKARSHVTLGVLDHVTFSRLLASSPRFVEDLLAFLSRRMRLDSYTLATTLQYVDVTGSERLYRECTPDERLVLDTVNHQVAAAESLDALMTFLFDRLRGVSACDRIGLAFLEENGARLTLRWCRATYGPLELAPGYSEDVSATSLGPVMVAGTPRVIPDLPDHATRHPGSRSAAMGVREGIRSSMACPLGVAGRPLGFLFYSSRRPGAFDDHQIHLHLAIAARVAQAVEKTHRLEQVTAAHQAYIEMLGFVSHELRSPLASVVMQAEAMKQGYCGALSPAQQTGLGKMIDKANYLLGLIEEYLNLSQVESATLTASSASDVELVSDLVEPAVELVQAQLESRRTRLTRSYPSQPCRVTCDPLLLKIVLVNLLGNAVKYGDEDGEVRVSVRSALDAVTVSVWNRGPGFPSAEKKNLFRKFSRLRTPELMQRKGTGIGLYTTWRIVQLHGGHIHGDSEPGQWAEFTFTLPQPPPWIPR